MFYNIGMDDIVRLRALCEQMVLEQAEDHHLTGTPTLDRTPDIPLMKYLSTLQSSQMGSA